MNPSSTELRLNLISIIWDSLLPHSEESWSSRSALWICGTRSCETLIWLASCREQAALVDELVYSIAARPRSLAERAASIPVNPDPISTVCAQQADEYQRDLYSMPFYATYLGRHRVTGMAMLDSCKVHNSSITWLCHHFVRRSDLIWSWQHAMQFKRAACGWRRGPFPLCIDNCFASFLQAYNCSRFWLGPCCFWQRYLQWHAYLKALYPDLRMHWFAYAKASSTFLHCNLLR